VRLKLRLVHLFALINTSFRQGFLLAANNRGRSISRISLSPKVVRLDSSLAFISPHLTISSFAIQSPPAPLALPCPCHASSSLSLPSWKTFSTGNDRPETKNAPLDRDIHISDIVQDKVYQRLVPVLAQEVDKGLGGEGLAKLVGGQAVLGEAVVKVVDRWSERKRAVRERIENGWSRAEGGEVRVKRKRERGRRE
jgi:hypothetical protein